MHRFFVSPASLTQEPIILRGDLAHQLSRVLRFRPGEHIVLLDDTGWAYEVELVAVSPSQCTAQHVTRWQPQTEPSLRLVLYQALTRESKFDWVLQKGTELGVAAFAPLLAARSLIPSAERIPAARWDRWSQIVTEAAEQSGRARRPLILPAKTPSQAFQALSKGAMAWIASPRPDAMPLSQVLRALQNRPAEVHLFIGPEGGFTSEELEAAAGFGVLRISLGSRTLRTETAAVAAAAVILYALGEMG